jgi:hypothetical protein
VHAAQLGRHLVDEAAEQACVLGLQASEENNVMIFKIFLPKLKK